MKGKQIRKDIFCHIENISEVSIIQKNTHAVRIKEIHKIGVTIYIITGSCDIEIDCTGLPLI